jgi:flavin-binding protein dodecin
MTGSVYKLIEVVGSSPDSWEAAARSAIDSVVAHVKDVRVAEVVEQDVRLEDNKIVEYRVKLSISFKYHAEMHE